MKTRRSLAMKLVTACSAALLAASATAQPFTSGSTGGGQAFSNEQPTLGLTYLVSTQGIFPSRSIVIDDSPAQISDTQLASIRMFAGTFAPTGTLKADGALLDINSNSALFSLVGTFYGGNAQTNFRLPDLTGRVSVGSGTNWQIGQTRGTTTTTLGVNNLPSHSHSFNFPQDPTASPTDNTGSGQSFNNIQPTLATNYLIATQGTYPTRDITVDGEPTGFSVDPFLGTVAQFAGNFTPRGWEKADGRLLDIASNTALFSILGVTYGGDGRETFGLPDLTGRTPVHVGQANGQSEFWSLGEKNGSETITLSQNQMPAHTHELTDIGGTSNPAGGNTPINNLQPGLGLNYIISLDGADPDSSGGSLEPMLGEIKLFAGSFAPRGWALLDGQILPISGNEDLFSLLGSTYGGDGRTTFALPDMRGRTGVHADDFSALGRQNGSDRVLLTEDNLPAHTHQYVPEPTSLTLLGLGGLLALRRRR